MVFSQHVTVFGQEISENEPQFQKGNIMVQLHSFWHSKCGKIKVGSVIKQTKYKIQY